MMYTRHNFGSNNATNVLLVSVNQVPLCFLTRLLTNLEMSL